MSDIYWGLPDPDRQREFYADVAMKRLFAWGIDMVLILLISALITVFTAFTALFVLVPLIMTVGFCYRVATIARWSATPGMRLLAIEFRTFRGEKFGLPLAFQHTLGYTISTAFVMPQVISGFMMVFSARGQGLTDMVLGTAAINRAAARI